MKKPYTVAEKFATAIVSPFVDAWVAMLLLGSAHSMDARVPALGYLTTLALVYSLICVVGTAAASANHTFGDRL